jgi:hypothetical protein
MATSRRRLLKKKEVDGISSKSESDSEVETWITGNCHPKKLTFDSTDSNYTSIASPTTIER